MPTGITIPLTFEIYQGDQLVRTETLAQDIIKIGKLSSSHLRIDDESVSRMHAVIEIVSATEINLIDLGSSKGTMVNGQKINKTQIKSGDEIRLGDTRLVVKVGEPVAQAVPAAAPTPKSTVMGMPALDHGASSTPGAAAAPLAVPPPSAAPPVPPPRAAVPPPTGAAIPPPSASAMGAAQATARPPMPPPPQGYVALDPDAIEVRDGSRAIEVMAMFEDAIVETRHFTNPRFGELTQRTIAHVGGGALCLLIAFILFLVSYFQVAKLKQDKEVWERTHPSGEMFLMPREGAGGDVAAGLLVVIGLGNLIYGLMRLTRERQPKDNPRDFTIGTDPKALYNVPAEHLPIPCFPLVHSTGQSYELCYTPGMKGDVTYNGQEQVPLAELAARGKAHASSQISGAYACSIPDGARAKIDFGESTFLVSSVAPPRRYPVPINLDYRSLSYTGGTILVCAIFLGMVFSLPPDPKSLSLDAFMNDKRFAKFLIKPPEEKEEQIPEWLKKKGPDEAGGKGKRHKGEEGKMGKKTSKNKTGLYALKGPKDNPDPHLAKQLAEEAAKNAGVLGVLKAQQGSHLSSIFGRDSALGTDAENVLGSLVGTQIGEAYGVGGLGLVGSGTGGGGTGEGTIGLGNLGTIGKGGGGGSGSGYGRGAGGLSGRRAHAPDVVPGTAQVRGALDKEIIRRIIRRHINEVKFCYEKELAKKPDLYGRVMIQFTISGNGQVVSSAVQNSTMNNVSVEQCIASAVRRWEFPKPQGGGVVIVSYPFVLKSAGSEE